MLSEAGIFVPALIESATCWSGAHGDNHLPSEPATIPGREAIEPSARALALSCLQGQPMKPHLFQKSEADVRLSPLLNVKFAPNGAGEISGYASAFDGPPDSYGDVIAKGAFLRTLAGHKREGTMPAMLWSHDQSAPIGRWLDMAEDDAGLHVRGRLNLETTRGKDAYEHLKSGDIGGLSIGWLLPEGGAKKLGFGTQLITDVELVEVSVVAVPANRRARVGGIKALSKKSELIDLLREGGLPKAAAERVAAGGWPALSGEDHQNAIDFAAEIKRAAEQLKVKS
jgi:HK97 family phage prohead protease